MKRVSKDWITVTVRLTRKQKELIVNFLDCGRIGLSTFFRECALKEIESKKS